MEEALPILYFKTPIKKQNSWNNLAKENNKQRVDGGALNPMQAVLRPG